MAPPGGAGVGTHLIPVEAVENHVEKITAATPQICEASRIIPAYLIDCWNWTRKKNR